MATYTCITCRVAFKDAEIQRAHYKTDWHRYNLKRKVAEMPPVTAENFEERVLAQRAVAEEQNKITATYCTVCSKRFSTFNAYENHLKSKKHLELEKKAVQAVNKKVEILNEKNLEKGLAPESVNKDEMNAAIQQAIRAQPSSSPKKTLLPPSNASSSPVSMGSTSVLQRRQQLAKPPRLQWFEQQAKKLAKQAEEEEEEDMEEGEAINILTRDSLGHHLCRYSSLLEAGLKSGQLKRPQSVRIPRKGFFLARTLSVLYLIVQLQMHLMEQLNGVIRCSKGTWVKEVGLYCASFITETIVSRCYICYNSAPYVETALLLFHRSSYPDHQDGEDVELHGERPAHRELDYDDDTMELILPSGTRLGHRSLMRYYRQRFGPSRAVVPAKNTKAVGRVLRKYRALGWTSETGAVFAQKRDLQYLQRMKSKWMLKTGMSNNATKQMHFRAQVRF
ncbi:Zinc finger protein 622 [Calypte anna]|uniref:Cytoplasmic 60S subunit biogenesis factor ZNF622 n=1 Tax=Calypte anna TaxID=9244 RepID=A0A091I8L4_CALAN|nr:Zinc finger protein 622 [Calypte anna]